MKISELCLNLANILHKFYFSVMSFPLPSYNFSLNKLAAIYLNFVAGLMKKQ